MHPFVSLNDKKIYFIASDSISPLKIWYVNIIENSWSNATQLDSPINNGPVFYPNQAKNGDLYYFSLSNGKMNYAPNKNDSFSEINNIDIEFGVHGFISSSQDFLLVNAKNNEDETRKDLSLIHI